MPPAVNGELVPTSPFDLTAPTTNAGFAAHSDQDGPDEQQPLTWLGAQPVTSLALSPDEQAAQDAERDRLLGLCGICGRRTAVRASVCCRPCGGRGWCGGLKVWSARGR